MVKMADFCRFSRVGMPQIVPNGALFETGRGVGRLGKQILLDKRDERK